MALSADGATALVGGYSDSGAAGQGGCTRATRRVTGGSRDRSSSARALSGVAQQGYGVALSADGNTALLGGPGDNNGVGATWVFIRDVSGAWSQQGSKLVGTGAVGHAHQGFSVAVSADGDTALVGGPLDPPAVSSDGAA